MQKTDFITRNEIKLKKIEQVGINDIIIERLQFEKNKILANFNTVVEIAKDADQYLLFFLNGDNKLYKQGAFVKTKKKGMKNNGIKRGVSNPKTQNIG